MPHAVCWAAWNHGTEEDEDEDEDEDGEEKGGGGGSSPSQEYLGGVATQCLLCVEDKT